MFKIVLPSLCPACLSKLEDACAAADPAQPRAVQIWCSDNPTAAQITMADGRQVFARIDGPMTEVQAARYFAMSVKRPAH